MVLSGRKKRILIVDDEPDVIVTIKAMLEKYDFAVDSYTVPSSALENFAADCYDLLILDVKMPRLSGFELYSKMKLYDNGIKVIFLTALKELSHYEDFKKEVSPKAGERHFVQKPVTDVELLEQVYSILN
jgi:two-component system catabolic regulation response regulator CreB/two-component system response regulator ChvI